MAKGVTVPITILTPKGSRTSFTPLREQVDAVVRDTRVAWFLATLNLRRDVFGLWLGKAWLVLEPLLQAGTYYVLLKYIFNLSGASVSFATFFTAATFWRSHATITIGACNLLVDSGRFVGADISLRIPYLEFLFSEILNFLIRFAVLIVFLSASGYVVGGSYVYLLYIAIAQFAFSFCLGIWLSVLGGFFRDLSRVVGHVVWLWWFFSPGLYSIGQVPDEIRWLYDLNPFAHIMPAMIEAATNGLITEVGPITNILFVSLLLMIPGGLIASQVKHRVLFRV